MSLRRPTLEEWFNAYQHRAIWREHSFMIGTMTVDATAIARDWEAAGEHPSFPAILTRAVALVTRAHPQLNRLYLRTLWGDRVVEFDGVHVNMPILLTCGGKPTLTAVALRDADQRSARSVRDELRAHKEAGIDGAPLTKLVASRPNNLLWRLVLRAVHFAAYRLPLVARYGGAVSVSCPASGARSWRAANFMGPSPSAFFLALSGVRREDGRVLLDLGYMADHLVIDGVTLRNVVEDLGALLGGTSPEVLAQLR